MDVSHGQRRLFVAKRFISPALWLSLFLAHQASAQQKLDLTNLSAFRSPSANWQLAGDVRADLSQNNTLVLSPGTGVLVSQRVSGKEPQDLFLNFSHSDADIEFDYMMAKGSNSGIYLQGRYEVQLFDSWGTASPNSTDNGAIYERWNDGKPNGQQGFEGHAPRQNASKAPGLWQHMKIAFQAPKFDAAGNKTDNAKILRVELNGVTIQENVDLTGPTRGAVSPYEVSEDTLRIQGDHGPLAFRNIVLKNYNKPRPVLSDLRYAVYKGAFDNEPDYKKTPPEAEGSSVILSTNINKIDNNFLIRYTGTLEVFEPGSYSFNLATMGGRGFVRINNQMVVPIRQMRGNGTIDLPKGKYPFELFYSKTMDWAKPNLGLAVSGPGIREYLISDANMPSGDPVDPILIEAPTNTTLRSFMDIDTFRVTHSISVGGPQKLSYTYDLDRGAIVQVWRGGFLDATPMWHERGDGSSRPVGMVMKFGTPMPAIEKLSSAADTWRRDTVNTSYRPKGYVLDNDDRPTFKYLIYGSSVSDRTVVMDNGQGLQREVNIDNPSDNLYLRVAAGSNFEPVGDNLYLVSDKSFYIRLDNANGAKPVIRDANGQKEMIIPVKNNIRYSIIF